MHAIYLLRFEWEFILIINCARYSVTCVGSRPLNLGKQYIYHDRVYYIYLYSWCTIKTTILQSGQFLSDDWCLLPLIQPLSPLDPRRHLHMLYIYIMASNCPNGILGLGEGASKNKLKDTSFIFSMINIIILSIFRTHAQKEYCKVLETNGIYIVNNQVLLLFENL